MLQQVTIGLDQSTQALKIYTYMFRATQPGGKKGTYDADNEQ